MELVRYWDDFVRREISQTADVYLGRLGLPLLILNLETYVDAWIRENLQNGLQRTVHAGQIRLHVLRKGVRHRQTGIKVNELLESEKVIRHSSGNKWLKRAAADSVFRAFRAVEYFTCTNTSVRTNGVRTVSYPAILRQELHRLGSHIKHASLDHAAEPRNVQVDRSNPRLLGLQSVHVRRGHQR